MKLVRVVFLILFTICILNINLTKVEANTSQFSMDAILPKNQINTDKTYFDLLVKPGTTQDISILLTNKTNDKLPLSIDITTAITNNHGVIDYTSTENNFDSSLLYPLSKLVDLEDNKITLEAKEQRKITLNITVPKKSFEGIILGGIYVRPVKTTKVNNIETQQAIVKAISLRMTEKDIPYDIQFIDKQIGQIGNRELFQVKIQNTQPLIMNDITIIARVFDKNNKTILENESKNIQMAPNSNFYYGIPLKQDDFEKNGNYTVQIKVKRANETWEFEEDFNVKSLNDNTNKGIEVIENESKINKIILSGLIILIILIIFIRLILFLRNKKNYL